MCLNVMAFSFGAHLQYTINNFKKWSTFQAVTKQRNQTGINIGSSAITKLQSCCANMYNCNNSCFRDDEWCNLANWPGTPTFCIWSRAPIALQSLMINVMEMKLHMFCAIRPTLEFAKQQHKTSSAHFTVMLFKYDPVSANQIFPKVYSVCIVPTRRQKSSRQHDREHKVRETREWLCILVCEISGDRSHFRINLHGSWIV